MDHKWTHAFLFLAFWPSVRFLLFFRVKSHVWNRAKLHLRRLSFEMGKICSGIHEEICSGMRGLQMDPCVAITFLTFRPCVLFFCCFKAKSRLEWVKIVVFNIVRNWPKLYFQSGKIVLLKAKSRLQRQKCR